MCVCVCMSLAKNANLAPTQRVCQEEDSRLAPARINDKHPQASE